MHGVESSWPPTTPPAPRCGATGHWTMTARVVCDFAASNDWRIPEHFTPDWKSQPDYNRKASPTTRSDPTAPRSARP